MNSLDVVSYVCYLVSLCALLIAMRAYREQYRAVQSRRRTKRAAKRAFSNWERELMTSMKDYK